MWEFRDNEDSIYTFLKEAFIIAELRVTALGLGPAVAFVRVEVEDGWEDGESV